MNSNERLDGNSNESRHLIHIQANMVSGHVEYDRLLKDLGEFGRFQVIFYSLLMLMHIPSPMHHLGQVFLAGSMDYTCTDKGVENSTTGACYYHDDTNTSQLCTEFEYNRSKAYTSTLVSEFDLVCSDVWMQAMSQTIYMLGVLWGVVVFGALADSYGRHKILMITVVLTACTGSATAFMPTYWSFVFARMFVGASVGGNMTTAFVIVMEFMGGKARTYCGMAVQSFFGLGTMLMALIAYYIRDFRHLQLTISVMYVLFFAYYWLIPESLCWQLSQGQEGTKTIKLMAKLNRRPCPEVNAYMMHPLEDDKVGVALTKSASVLDLYKTPNLRNKTLNVQFNWFVNSLVYYGISLLATDLAGNIYVNTVFSGLAEFIACIAIAPFAQKFGRRSTLSFCLIFCGLICVCAIPVPEHLAVLRTAMSMIGKFFISGTFAIIYVYSAELFPTVVRNVGVGSGSMCARVGGLISPFIALMNKVWKPMPFFVFGGFSLAAGLLSLLLPETLNQAVPDTIEDGENFGKGERLLCVSCFDHDPSDHHPHVFYDEHIAE